MSLEVDTRKFQSDMIRLSKKYGLGVSVFMKQQTSMLARDLLNSFPPSKKLAGGKEGLADLGAASEKSLGMNAVETGIREVIQPLEPVEIRRAIDIRGSRGAKMVRSEKSYAPWAVQGVNFQPSASASRMRTKHEANRVRGRVKQNAIPEGSLGNLKMSNKLHVRKAAFKRYVRARQQQVGQLKSGWYAGIDKWKQYHRISVAGWKKRNWESNGTAGGNIDNNGNGVLHLKNRVPYASEYKRIVKYVVRNRKRLAEKRLKYQLKQLMRAESRVA